MRCTIRLHPGKPRSHGVGVEEVVADLQIAVQEHGDLVAPLLLQPRVAVDVNHLDLEVIAALELLQGRDEVVAQVAILAAEDGEPGLHSGSGRNVT